MKVGFNRFAEHINRYFQEAIEVILVFAMLVFGIITLLPMQLLPGATSVYVSNLAKVPFGLLLVVPSSIILWLRTRHNIHDYVFLFKKHRQQCLFYMTIGWLYLTVLRVTISYFPPFYVLYFCLGLITYLCYVRLSK